MENIGDWLYVLVLIIAGISSIINSIHKKSRQASEQSRQTQPREIVTDDTFDDDFWGEITNQLPVPESQPSRAVQPKLQTQPIFQPATKQSKYRFDKTQEGQRSISSINTDCAFADNEEEHASITLEDLPSNTEEWRKAFIHNEIFNRKY